MKRALSALCHTEQHADCPRTYDSPRIGVLAGILYIDQAKPAPGESLFLTRTTCLCACHSRQAITQGQEGAS